MPTQYHPAIIERAEGGFGVFFPDIPGCTSGGATIDAAARNAEEGLVSHVELMLESGLPLPRATPLDRLRVDDDIGEVGRILVRCDSPVGAVRSQTRQNVRKKLSRQRRG